MQFDSFSFVVFFIVVFAVHLAPISWTLKKINLLVASYVFYAAWQAPFVLLILFSTLVDWYAAKFMARSTDKRLRAVLLIVSLTVNLGLLSVFKYSQFFLDSWGQLVTLLGFEYQHTDLGILLPVGISFYTLQTLSYTIDVYRKSLKPAESFLDFATYVAFFPQLVAGPIVRASHFLPLCATERRPTFADFNYGITLFLIGLWEKSVLADGIMAPVVQGIFDGDSKFGMNWMTAWIGTLAFAGQIFFDFSGYSNCAIGVARCFGFELPINFKFPYASRGLSEYWKRWHISLSTWLRDYLFWSLLLRKKKKTGKLYQTRYMVVTMLIAGLWHGPSWNMVVWGGLHGVYLVLERVVESLAARWKVPSNRFTTFLAWGATFGSVCIAYVFFRASTFTQAFEMIGAMFGTSGLGASAIFAEFNKTNFQMGCAMLIVVGLLALHWKLRDVNFEQAVIRLPAVVRGLAIAAMLLSILTMAGETVPFIYFQF